MATNLAKVSLSNMFVVCLGMSLILPSSRADVYLGPRTAAQQHQFGLPAGLARASHSAGGNMGARGRAFAGSGGAVRSFLGRADISRVAVSAYMVCGMGAAVAKAANDDDGS